MEFKIKEYVTDLFNKGFEKEKVEQKILQFFKDYDSSKEPQINRVQRKIEMIKKNNSRVKNSHAQDFADRTEIENLFLESVDESKKEAFKRKSIAPLKNSFPTFGAGENS